MIRTNRYDIPDRPVGKGSHVVRGHDGGAMRDGKVWGNDCMEEI